MPEHIAGYVATWTEHHPDWRHLLWVEDGCLLHRRRGRGHEWSGPVAGTTDWTDRLVNADLWRNADRLFPHNAEQFRSDVARLELLHRYGGVYVDADFECRSPLDPHLDGIEAFAIYEVDDVWVANGLIGATPGHPFVTELIDALPWSVRRELDRRRRRKARRPNAVSGPHFVTEHYRRQPPGLVHVFSQAMFLPYSWNELHRQGEEFPDAVAVHHWHNARTNPHRAGRPS